MYNKIGYELAVILIVGILHTGLLKKIMDTFLLIGDRNRLIWKIVFVGYYLLTTAAYSVFHVSHSSCGTFYGPVPDEAVTDGGK